VTALKPVVTFTTSDRIDYATRTLDSWRNVRGVENALLMFSCEPFIEMVDLVRSADFAETVIDVNERTLGNEVNSFKALAAGFETGAGFVIQAEDDVLVAADVLEYLAWAAETYADDESVLTVSGYQNAVRGKPDEVFRRQWFTACIWGMWRRSWDQVRERWPGGPTPHSWDWYLCEQMKATGTVAIEPCVSRGQHIGVTGAHGSHPEHLAAEWEAQRFTPGMPPQDYREISA
jgi:GNT-I family